MSSRTMLAAALSGLVGVMFLTAARADTDTRNAVRVAGQVTQIDGTMLTIAPAAGEATVITCSAATRISRDGEKSLVQAKFEDLQVGQQVRAYYSKADNAAAAVIIANAPAANSAP